MSKRKRNFKCSPDKKAHRIKDNVRMMASVSWETTEAETRKLKIIQMLTEKKMAYDSSLKKYPSENKVK